MPDANLKIILSAIDKASGPMKGFSGNLKALAGQVPGLGAAMGLLTNPITLVGAGLAATGKIMKDSVNETIAYADQVRDLSRSLGTNSEESSKLIQVADDLFVSYGTLTVAMKTAQRQGINPNIEGLMGLAEKYQALKDPAERAAFALKTFGRSGLEMTKILEKTPDQLKAMGDALEGSNLIMSQDSVDAAYKYKQAMDELGDTWQGLKYQVGSALIPALTEATKGFTTHAAATIGLLNAAKSGKITWAEYIAQSAKVTWTSYDAADAQVWLNGKLVEARDATKKYNESNMDARDRIAELIPVIDDETEAMGILRSSMSDLKTFMDGPLGKSSDDFKTKMDELNTKLAENQTRRELLTTLPVLTDEQRTELGELQTEYGEISAAITKTADDHELATKRMLLDLLIQRAGLTDMTAEGQTAFFNMTTSIAENWGLIDEQTAIATRGMDAAMQGFASGTGTQAALNTFYSLVAQAHMLEGTHEILFNIRTTGEMPTIHGGQISYGNARGADYIVPPGYSNERWNVGTASSGERVTITPANQITNNNNSRMTMNVHTNAQSSTLLRDYRMLQARAG